MDPSIHDLAQAFCSEASAELDDAIRKIKHCLGQLNDEQVWWRPPDEMNSIANLILHLCGNVRQWIVAGVGGAQDIRDRPQEFAQRGQISKEELTQKIEATVADAKAAIQSAPLAELVRSRSIQSFDVTGIGAIIHSISHFRGHTQEIVHLTRSQLGDAYEFDFVPPPQTN